MCPEYSVILFACKWLRAVKRRRLQPGTSEYNAEFSAMADGPITGSECFKLLAEACSNPQGPSPHPSWSIFHNFAQFVNRYCLAY